MVYTDEEWKKGGYVWVKHLMSELISTGVEGCGPIDTPTRLPSFPPSIVPEPPRSSELKVGKSEVKTSKEWGVGKSRIRVSYSRIYTNKAKCHR